MQGFEFNLVGRFINGSGSALKLASQCQRLVIGRPTLAIYRVAYTGEA